jgi:hypothetical protein
MAKKQIFVFRSSLHPQVTLQNKAVGNAARVRRRFTRGGEFFLCLYQGLYLHGSEIVRGYCTIYGWGTNQIAWYDWYEA